MAESSAGRGAGGVVGGGLTLLSTFAPMRFKEIPDYALDIGIVIGVVLMLWGFAPFVRSFLHLSVKVIEPLHIIILGVSITIGGVAWQLIQTKRSTQAVAATHINLGSPEQTKASPPLKPMLTEYDVSRRQKAIDEILDFLETVFLPENAKIEKFKQRFFAAVSENTAVSTLQEQSEAIGKTREIYYQLIDRYRNFADIYQAAFASTWEPELLVRSATMLRSELREIEQRGQHGQEQALLKNNTLFASWQTDTTKLWPWINERKDGLFELRKKYENAEVYPHAR